MNIAYWTLGEGPPLLMVNFPRMSHLQLEWEVASLRKFYEGLAGRFRLIRYNTRNAGLSDRNVEPLQLGDFVRDVEAVVTACTDGPVALLAVGAAPIAIQYAADSPERVSALIIIDGFAISASQSMEVYTAAAASSVNMAVETYVNAIDPGRSDF